MIGGEEQRWLYGSYSCIAKNIYGYVTDSASLVEAGTSFDDAPQSVGLHWLRFVVNLSYNLLQQHVVRQIHTTKRSNAA